MTPVFEWQNPDKLLAQVQELLRQKQHVFKRVPELAVRAGAIELQSMIRAGLPKRTVALSRSVDMNFSAEGGAFLARIGSSLRYARWVEEGTGVYGPQGRPIVPVKARALRWTGRPVAIASDLRSRRAIYSTSATKGGRTTVLKRADPAMIFRRSVRGMKPRPVYRESVLRFLPRYAAIIQRELAREAQA